MSPCLSKRIPSFEFEYCLASSKKSFLLNSPPNGILNVLSIKELSKRQIKWELGVISGNMFRQASLVFNNPDNYVS